MERGIRLPTKLPYKAVEVRQQKQKQLFIKQMEGIPVIAIACQRIDISRSTYYRWIQEDFEFDNLVKEARVKGVDHVNDAAESGLISLIHEKHPTSIYYWLNNHHVDYNGNSQYAKIVKPDEIKLSKEEEESIQVVLKEVKEYQSYRASRGATCSRGGIKSNDLGRFKDQDL